MLKRIIILMTLLGFLFNYFGCAFQTSHEISLEQFNNLDEYESVTVLTTDNKKYELYKGENIPGPEISDSLLTGWRRVYHSSSSYNLKEVKILLSDIDALFVYQYEAAVSAVGTIIGIAAILTLGFIILLSTDEYFN